MGGLELAQLIAVIALGITVVLLLLQVRRGKEEVARREAHKASLREELRRAVEQEAADVRQAANQLEREAHTRVAGLLNEVERARTEVEQARAEVDRQRRELAERHATERAEIRESRTAVRRREERLSEREDRLDAELHEVEVRAGGLEERRRRLADQESELAQRDRQFRDELARIAGLTAEQARTELLAAVEQEAHREATVISRDIESGARREAERRARHLIVQTIQRLATEQTTESVVTTVELPGDDMKGRIIGREGRNIRALEQVTGVNVMVDDTPGSVLISCFDPVRRETARLTLSELVADGRIHPARIEEVHARSRAQISEDCLRAAEEAVAEMDIHDLHPDLMPVLGALRYRTSYGQNVLKHLVECGHIAGMMAADLGLDVRQCKRAAFLHDIGKALTHEVEGTHAIIGANLARKYGENPDIVHAIEAHHNEVEPRTVEAVLTQACDAISGGRPGARRESLEAYVKRLERLEAIAAGHDGVEKVFAMQAGREVRVMVTPEQVDDIEAQVLARAIVKQIEEELTYPGQIRVTVVRESRATELAR